MQKISEALVKAQKEFGPALKSSTNPHFKSKYADLGAVVEAVVDALNNNGIFLNQQTMHSDTGVIVSTVFVHESGETLNCGPLHVPATKQDAQGYGSALTYARRYSLMAACGVAPEDDDGNEAVEAAKRKQEAEKKSAQEKREKFVADWRAKLDECSTQQDVAQTWATIKSLCEQSGDAESYNQLGPHKQKIAAQLRGAENG